MIFFVILISDICTINVNMYIMLGRFGSLK